MLEYAAVANDLSNLSGFQPQKFTSYSYYLYIAGWLQLSSMFSPL